MREELEHKLKWEAILDTNPEEVKADYRQNNSYLEKMKTMIKK